jgi:hypothetical protein
MASRIPKNRKEEAIRLRVEQRLGLKAICRLTGLSRGSASNLLREYPLTEEEIKSRLSRNAQNTNELCGKYSPDLSKYASLLTGQDISRECKGRIAEAAVLFRLALHGFNVWKAQFDGNRADWLVSRADSRRHVLIQVKWARRDQYGRPFFPVTRRCGKRIVNISPADCDFVVGYDLETDTAFVFPVEDIQAKRTKSCNPKYAEAWHLLDV